MVTKSRDIPKIGRPGVRTQLDDPNCLNGDKAVTVCMIVLVEENVKICPFFSESCSSLLNLPTTERSAQTIASI